MTDRDRKDEQQGTREFRMAWQGAEVTIVLPLLPVPGTDPPYLALEMAAINPGWSFLSQLSARVLLFLAGSDVEWLKGEEIARRLTESEHGKLKHVLTDMAERNLLESGPAGYRLAVPAGVAREDYRVALAEYLVREQPSPGADSG